MNYLKCIDAIRGMKGLESESIHLIVTSPPYKEEDGFSEKLITDFAREAERILKPGCFCIVIAGHLPMKFDVPAFISMELNKHLDFFYKIIWHKTFKKGGGIGVTYQYPFPYNFYPNIMCEDILVYKKKGKREKKRKQDEYSRELISHCRIDIWDYYPSKHYCSYPEKLIDPIIRFWSYTDDLILDPFMGSGTTAVVCKKLNRRFIGFEININEIKFALSRISDLSAN